MWFLRKKKISIRIFLGGYHWYQVRMVRVSGGFGKGMFWCDFTLDLPKISAKEPFNPPLLPFSSLHPSITDSMLVAGVFFDPSLLPTLACSDQRHFPRNPRRLRALAQCRLKCLHCSKEPVRLLCFNYNPSYIIFPVAETTASKLEEYNRNVGIK